MPATKSALTIKAHVAAKVQVLNDDSHWVLTFQPDYADGANASWADGTPAAAVEVNVLTAVADLFESGDAVAITFTPGA